MPHPQTLPATPQPTYPRLPDLGVQTPFRALIGIFLGMLTFLIVAPLISQAVTMAGWLIDGRPDAFTIYAGEAARFQHPAGMLGANLGIIALIPLTIALLTWVNRAPKSWVWSVTGRLRWRYLLACLVAALVLFGVAVTLIEQPAGRLSSGTLPFLLIIVLTSPLQAAAEEVFFRGYLNQSVATLTGQTLLGILVPAVLFALWHGTQNFPLITSRFAFGLLAGVLAWITGGLEAPVAAHVANNLGSYLPALLTGQLTAARTITEVSWAAAGYQISVFATITAVAWLIARRAGLQTRRTTTSRY